jgi:hypothetical protein
VVVEALDDHIDFDRRQAGGDGGLDPLQNAPDGEVDIIHLHERLVVDGVQTDRDALQAGLPQGRSLVRQQGSVRRQRQLDPGQRRQQDQPLQSPQQGPPPVRRILPTLDVQSAPAPAPRTWERLRGRKACSRPKIPSACSRRSEVAAVGDRDAQVVEGPAQRVVREFRVGRHRLVILT